MSGTRDKDHKIGRVGILAGGLSSERNISLASGRAVYDALTSRGIDTTFIDIGSHIDEDIQRSGSDIYFIALHGGIGEDGTIQKILEDLGTPFTGSGSAASRLAMDKISSRKIFEEMGLDVPRYKIIKRGDPLNIDELNLPLVIKPSAQGSSIGLSLVLKDDSLKEAVDNASLYGDEIIAEEFIKGRELTVGILNDEPLPVVEIIPDKHCYDYIAKYESKDTKYLVPAPIEKHILHEAQEKGLAAHKALGCRSFSRVDMILADNGRLYILEVNTIPGLTSRSLLPKAAEYAGLNFDNLCLKILEGAK